MTNDELDGELLDAERGELLRAMADEAIAQLDAERAAQETAMEDDLAHQMRQLERELDR